MINRFIIKYRIQKVKDELEDILINKNINYKINLIKKQSYQILIELPHQSYFVKVLKIPTSKELVITSKETWIISHQGEVNIKNIIKTMKDFMNIKVSEKTKKIVIVYPEIYKILQYINENEMIIVESYADVYSCKVIGFKDLNKEHFPIG